MELSFFLAKLMGLSLALFAVLGIIRPRIVSDAIDNFDSSSLVSLFFGFIGIVVGLAIVLSHNVWEASWRVLITLFGWAALLKGVTYIVAPDALLNIGNTVYKNHTHIRVVLMVSLLVGSYLAWKGFGN